MKLKGEVSKNQLLFLIGLSSAPLLVLACLHFFMGEFAAGFLYGFFAVGLLFVCLFRYKAQENMTVEVVGK